MNSKTTVVSVNGREYRWPDQPVVVVCIDGSEPDYIEHAIAAGVMPWMQKVVSGQGSDLRADCVVPSFTNPNNISIVTGVPPVVHGICGNFYYDKANDREVMMNEPELLRTPTIFKAFQDAGAKVAIITAKDKLRRLLGNELRFGADGATCFSSEKSDQVSLDENGIDNVLDMVGMEVPSVYSAELSEFIFAAGVKLMETVRPDLMYLSTTDYIQHKFAPGSAGANSFYAMMDGYWAQLDALGAVVALTADHGMNAKHDQATGQPNIIYLQDEMDRLLSPGAARVILPITDPYVVHHGALGSYATVYLPDDADIDRLKMQLADIDGIDAVYANREGCERFQLAPDRMGDLILVSSKHVVIGTTAARHDLSGLDVPLRSHGGVTEQTVPLIVSRRVTRLDPSQILHNYDIFNLALNHVAH
ncbi:MAG: phosphonoacetate hydrolase [Gammaproteobacteria bacterium]|nr:phosphonoacetate hydrolase [Gammaproteobacteria bacterium]MDH3535852.1 phosphonoacetate hydrolase [Gammaproteobacteria bacterium]